MPNQINSKNMTETYDAGDLEDAYSLARSDMQWMQTAIRHVKKEIIGMQNLAESGTPIHRYYFSELITHLEMYEYIADERHNHHDNEAEAYKAEWKKAKACAALDRLTLAAKHLNESLDVAVDAVMDERGSHNA